MQIGNLITRKILTTFITTTIFSFMLSFLYLKSGSDVDYNKGNQFISWFFVYFMFIGVIVLVYGNLVSIGIEYLQGKLFKKHDWLYVLILGIFGLANGIIFQETTLAYYGMLAAMVYGIIDKWLYKRQNKSVKMFYLIPIASVFLLWMFLQMTSPPMPPFTKEDAVQSATAGEGTTIDYFPKTIGKWEGVVDGYHVVRETNAKQIGKEIYLVTFTENWSKGTKIGSWTQSYKVERNGLTADAIDFDMPPYYGDK
ncbi:hypothetical protein [Lederbergia citrea]|uniref:hypothetical protein n=1 Tax=Lederbergia citrea TaxID=2833581 RepID=UPI001BC9466D|nr:hypothetical protein [Lederbergia citrea]MBS4204411.1 hypothetical protein [Lederbergia citrea]